MEDNLYQPDLSFSSLRQFTAARIAIGRTGTSIPLQESLNFKLAHAHARDAVYSVLDFEKLITGLRSFNLPVVQVYSQNENRHQYLQRPDQGRLLDAQSKELLASYCGEADVVIVIADGLSAQAVNLHAVQLLNLLIPKLTATFTLAPLVIAHQGRVALADEIAYLLNAKLSIILIGERPGLSSADSMGAYLTYSPRPGLTDESRNCVSNIRLGGLSFTEAADKIFYLVTEAFRLQLSGVLLKDNFGLLKE